MSDHQKREQSRQRLKRKRRSRRKLNVATILRAAPRPSDLGALVVFALIVIGGPLAFGAVDQLIQVVLLALLALGLFLRSPEVVPLSRRAGGFVLALTAVLVLKEFAPAALFGSVSWRKTLVESYGLALPWTHHPEPGRAIDALLTAAIAVLWFLWVRTLAARRENRIAMGWILFSAAVLVAAVSFATKGIDQKAIYGLRYTPGWRGFGPFPNRNHTACFLAMGTVIGLGCLTWAGARRRYLLLGFGVVVAALPLAALLTTQSRGGLLAFAVGSALYALLLLWKLRSERSLALIATAGFVAVALALSFGGPLFARFGSAESEVSNSTRVQLWHDALFMWRDAPLFGHGAGSFASIFPMYQRIQLDNQIVLHPESSWLQWLAELGLVPMLLAVACGLWFSFPQVRDLFRRRHGFYFVAAALCAATVLLVHCAIDVPGHRWGTAGFALAALALGMPTLKRTEAADAEWNLEHMAWQRAARRCALIPLGIAVLWSVPFLADWPRWSPLTAARLTDRDNTRATVPTEDLDEELAWFPLNSPLHQLRGFHELQRQSPKEDVWLRHFRLALRLNPGSWALPVSQARECLDRAPLIAISFWQQAIERAGFRGPELFATAISETSDFPGAQAAWSGYVEAHPALALIYARALPVQAGRAFYEGWWSKRGSKPGIAFDQAEIRAFYDVAPQWASPAQFQEWMRLHTDRGVQDYRAWAAVLHAWHDDSAAWRLLARHTPEPVWPPVTDDVPREQLAMRWERLPGNLMNAQLLATADFRAGDTDKALDVLLTTAARPDGPIWFAQKAAYLLASKGKLDQAVEALLKPPAPGAASANGAASQAPAPGQKLAE